MTTNEKMTYPYELSLEYEQELDAKAEELCRWAAARAGVVVVAPVLGTGALIANEIYLINRLAKLYNRDVTEGAIVSFAGAIGGTIVGNLLATLIPISIIQVPIAVSVTYGVGKAAHAWIKEGMPDDLTPYVEMFKEWSAVAKAEVKVLAENSKKNIPLGDERRKFIEESGESISKGVADMKSKIQDSLEEQAELFVDTKDVLAERASMGLETASEKVSSAVETLAEIGELLKEHALLKVEEMKAKKEEGVCPVSYVKDKARDLAEGYGLLDEEKSEKIIQKISNTAETLRETSEVLRERAAMGIDDLKEYMGDKDEIFKECSYLLKEKTALTCEDAKKICDQMQEKIDEITEILKDKGEFAKEKVVVTAQSAKDAYDNTSKGKKIAAAAVVSSAILLAVIAMRFDDIVEVYKKNKNLGKDELARIHNLVEEAKKMSKRVTDAIRALER